MVYNSLHAPTAVPWGLPALADLDFFACETNVMLIWDGVANPCRHTHPAQLPVCRLPARAESSISLVVQLGTVLAI